MAVEYLSLLYHSRTVSLPCLLQAPTVSLRGHPSMSFQWRWGPQVSTVSRGHQRQRWDLFLMGPAP